MKNIVIDYDLAISNFLQDVKTWLDERVPRDRSEMKDVEDTKKIWALVCADPRTYTKYEKLYGDVCNNSCGFLIKKGTYQFDNTMRFAVISVLDAMSHYYECDGDYQKQVLASEIKKYKLLRAKNMFARFKVSLTNPKKLLAIKQR